MDSLTQLALGAAVGEAMAGKQSGRKAAAWGAFLGTFPDLDVFIPMGTPIGDFIYHRSFSHSFLVLGILAPLFAWLICKFHKYHGELKKRWLWSVFAIFYTHILLDSFTVYGTQVFWPFTTYPVSIGSIFIIDPMYTVPLLVGGIAYLTKRSAFMYRVNLLGLIVSSLYLVWTISVQSYVERKAIASFNKQSYPTTSVLVTPTPFNTILWRIVSIDKDGYFVGYYSLFDKTEKISFKKIPSSYERKEQLSKLEGVKELYRFSHNFVSINQFNNHWVVSDIRMGIEPDYVFQFAVAKAIENDIKPIPPTRHQGTRDMSRVKKLYRRIWDETIDF